MRVSLGYFCEVEHDLFKAWSGIMNNGLLPDTRFCQCLLQAVQGYALVEGFSMNAAP